MASAAVPCICGNVVAAGLASRVRRARGAPGAASLSGAARTPYAANGRRHTTNERDGIYRGGGDQLMLKPARSGAGYDAIMDIALEVDTIAMYGGDARETTVPPP